MVPPDATVGLGTGRAAARFLRALAERMERESLRLRGVPTSAATETLAAELGVPLVSLDAGVSLDIAVDGADEVDPDLHLVKGHGGAMVRERVVAAAAKRFVVLVGEEKLTPRLGASRPIPVEVIPFAAHPATDALRELGAETEIRRGGDGRPFATDNGNWIANAAFPTILDPHRLLRQIRDVPGVVDAGLFLDMADEVLVEAGDVVKRLSPTR